MPSPDIDSAPLILSYAFHIGVRQALNTRKRDKAGPVRSRIVHAGQTSARRGYPKPAEMVNMEAEDRTVGQAVGRSEDPETAILVADQIVPVKSHPDISQTVLCESGCTPTVWARQGRHALMECLAGGIHSECSACTASPHVPSGFFISPEYVISRKPILTGIDHLGERVCQLLNPRHIWVAKQTLTGGQPPFFSVVPKPNLIPAPPQVTHLAWQVEWDRQKMSAVKPVEDEPVVNFVNDA